MALRVFRPAVALLAVALGASTLGAWGGFGTPAHASLPHAPSAPALQASGNTAASAFILKSDAPKIVRADDAAALRLRGSGDFMAPAMRASAGTVIRVAQWGGSQRPQNPIENFFSTLFGGGRQQPDPRQDRTRILITPGASGQGEGSSQKPAQTRTSGGGSGAFCVRTCDGRFFPLGARVDRGSYGAGAAACQSLCPAAQMDLYTGSSDISSASNSRGRVYAALPTAFLFRRQLVEGCSCHASGGEGGLRHIDIKDDPTLKAGDVVMTAQGFRVFTGGRRGPPFRDSDFVSPSSFPKLSKEMRQRLKELTFAAR